MVSMISFIRTDFLTQTSGKKLRGGSCKAKIKNIHVEEITPSKHLQTPNLEKND